MQECILRNPGKIIFYKAKQSGIAVNLKITYHGVDGSPTIISDDLEGVKMVMEHIQGEPLH